MINFDKCLKIYGETNITCTNKPHMRLQSIRDKLHKLSNTGMRMSIGYVGSATLMNLIIRTKRLYVMNVFYLFYYIKIFYQSYSDFLRHFTSDTFNKNSFRTDETKNHNISYQDFIEKEKARPERSFSIVCKGISVSRRLMYILVNQSKTYYYCINMDQIRGLSNYTICFDLKKIF